MSWFKKKEEEELLPNLPESSIELPNLPESGRIDASAKVDNPTIDSNLGSLPPPPSQNTSNMKNNQLQKSNFEPLPISSEAMTPKKMVAAASTITPGVGRIPNMESTKTSKLSGIKENKPIYIRLDKFKAGLESFEEIKNKIRDIEELLLNIREIKQKEEIELNEWEREIQIIKSRIESIDSNVFGKLDQ